MEIAHASSAGQVIFGEFLRLGHQRQTGLYEPLGEHQPVEFRPRLHHQREVLLDLGEPGEVDLGCKQLGCAP